jgi:hypothetical protein
MAVAGAGLVVGAAGGALVAGGDAGIVTGVRVVFVEGVLGAPPVTTAPGATTTLGIVTGVPGAGSKGAGDDGGTTVSLVGACGCAELAFEALTSRSGADASVTPPASGGGLVGSLGPGAVDSPSIGPTTAGCAGWRAHALALALALTTASSADRRTDRVMNVHAASRVPATRGERATAGSAKSLRDPRFRRATRSHYQIAACAGAPRGTWYADRSCANHACALHR